jgi:hypothetical protein
MNMRSPGIVRRHRRLRPWRIPLDGRPLSHREIAEARAVRLALLLCVAVLKNEQFPDDTAPITPDLFDTPTVWLQARLRHLAAHARVVRDVSAILDETGRTSWDDPQRLGRAMRCFERQSRRLQPIVDDRSSRRRRGC